MQNAKKFYLSSERTRPQTSGFVINGRVSSNCEEAAAPPQSNSVKRYAS